MPPAISPLVDMIPQARAKQSPMVTLDSLELVARGKVRDLYRIPDGLLMVASDRISAFDVVMPTAIPDKGRILTRLSLFWFEKLRSVVANHVVSTDLDSLDLGPDERAWLEGRSMIVREADVMPVECVVRGYLAGSGWKDYQANGTISGLTLPRGLRHGARLPEPVFTPSTKAPRGAHDQTITFADVADRIGRDRAGRLRSLALELYEEAHGEAGRRGIILADTKFEFGIIDDDIVLVDECLTSDSSRFWPADSWQPGAPPPSLDKQILRAWLETRTSWDRTPPAPDLPPAITERIRLAYIEACERLTGQPFS